MDAKIVGSGNIDATAAPRLEFSAYLSRLGRAEGRTRTAVLPSLGVINRALRGIANPLYLKGFLSVQCPVLHPIEFPVVSEVNELHVTGFLANQIYA
jgi:hypothetical protein